jgi:hypothetical protein
MNDHNHTHNKCDIQQMVKEIENIIKNNINSVLKNHVDRFNMLEETHSQIMRLPSVLNELNRTGIPAVVSHNIACDLTAQENVASRLIRREMETVEKRFINLEMRNDAIMQGLEKIIAKVDALNEDVRGLKHAASSETENIKLEIVEEPCSTKEDNEEESEEEEEEEESEEEEEDLTPQIKVVKMVPDVVNTEEEEEEEEESEEEVEVEEESEEEVEVEEESEEEVEVEEEVEEAEEAEEDEVETEASDEEEEEEEEELFEIEIDDVAYCTNDDENGFIYQLNDGEVGDKVGYLKEGEPFFYADEK